MRRSSWRGTSDLGRISSDIQAAPKDVRCIKVFGGTAIRCNLKGLNVSSKRFFRISCTENDTKVRGINLNVGLGAPLVNSD